jgi:methyl-accepting chemotaxis protein
MGFKGNDFSFRPSLPKLSLSAQAMLLTFFITLALSIIGIWTDINNSRDQLSKFKEKIPSEIKNTWNELITSKAATLLSSATIIARMPLVAQYYLMDDKVGLESSVQGIQDEISHLEGTSIKIHFHKPPAISFLRVWAPEKNGDDLSDFRKIVVSVNKTGEPMSGIEAGREGLALRAVAPIFFMDQQVGSVELFSGLAPFAGKAGSLTGSSISVYTLKDALTDARHNGPAEFVLSNQDPTPNNLDPDFLKKGLVKTAVKETNNAILTALPIKDFSGKAIGVLVARTDIADIRNAFASKIQSTLLKGVVSIFVFLLLVYYFLKIRLKRPLSLLTGRMKDLCSGETDLTKHLELKTVNCSKVMRCHEQDCPCYGKDVNCWHEAGSMAPEVHCLKIKSGEIEGCEQCPVFKNSVTNEVDQVKAYLNAFVLRIQGLVMLIQDQALHVNEQANNIIRLTKIMADDAKENQSLAKKINNSAKDTSSDVQGVASAMEEIASAVTEIARNSISAREVSVAAKTEAVSTKEAISRLHEASSKIGQVSNLIGSVADQTNLLALNATIEAARAGSYGKGFAVVAGEVKALARQTGKSVAEIDTMVHAIQGETKSTLTAVDNIVSVISTTADHVNGIAAAVEQQTAMSIEVSDGAQKISKDVSVIRQMSLTIATAGERTVEGVEKVEKAMEKLLHLSSKLQGSVAKFRT